jgi:hypothetical protein
MINVSLRVGGGGVMNILSHFINAVDILTFNVRVTSVSPETNTYSRVGNSCPANNSLL